MDVLGCLLKPVLNFRQLSHPLHIHLFPPPITFSVKTLIILLFLGYLINHDGNVSDFFMLPVI